VKYFSKIFAFLRSSKLMAKGKNKNKNKTKEQHVSPNVSSFGQTATFASASASPTAPASSVRDLIERLRREQAPKASREQVENVSRLGTLRSLPAEIRNILHLPEANLARDYSDPLRRRTAGPLPPKSWAILSQASTFSRYQQAAMAESSGNKERLGSPNILSLLDVGSQNLPAKGSLMDYALACASKHWHFVRVYDFNTIPLLPTAIKASLLSYLSLYEANVDLESLQQIMCDDVLATKFSVDIVRLDLTGLLSPSLSLKDIKTLFCPTKKRPGVDGMIKKLNLEDELTMGPESQGGSSTVSEESLSWEQMAEKVESSIPVSPIGMNFPNLTHLSLAKADKYSSWAQLLEVAIHLKTLTHLSLAHWPIPSMTPTNSKWLPYETPHEISVGFSRPGVIRRNAFWEASDILRRLSNRTYCLRWLDLEGCNGWIAALRWNGDEVNTHGRSKWDADSYPNSHPGPDWTASWVQVRYINLSQGWVPCDRSPRSRRTITTALTAALLAHLKSRALDFPSGSPESQQQTPLAEQRRQRAQLVKYVDAEPDVTAQWLLNEQESWLLRKHILQLRAQYGPFCRINLGWGEFAENASIV
jgi:hypothetical protein